MRVPDLQPIAAGTAALLLVASIGWWLLSAPQVIDPGQPSWKGADIVRLTASVPQIDRFERFYVNDDNPFIPLQARLAENERRKQLREGPGVVPKAPPRPVAVLPPRAPVKVVEPEQPKLVLPKLSPTPANAPIVFGLVAVDNQEALTVRMPGAKDSIRLLPGEKVDGWTLLSIDNGNLANFTDPQGSEHQFVIGQGDLAVAQNEEGSGKGAVPNGSKGPGGHGMVPKPPTPGGTRPPGPGGADGAIPKPPPREEHRRPPKDPPKDPQGNPIVLPPPKK
ncbi:MAG TPA: hypothetical protein VHX44_03050 [Planctomycetota bacterium]|nr:hypothetical protein [Planctomycetota bacterium]